jgi:hypothetical protein
MGESKRVFVGSVDVNAEMVRCGGARIYRKYEGGGALQT